MFEDLKRLQEELDFEAFLSYVYREWNKVVEANPELAPDVEAVKIGLNPDKNSDESLRGAYDALLKIAEAKPDLAPDVLETFKIGLNSDKNSDDSLLWAYEALHSIAKAKTDLAPAVLETFKIGLNSDKNSDDSLYRAYDALYFIAKENQWLLAPDVLEAVKIGVNSDNSPIPSRVLLSIAQNKPELASDALEVVEEMLVSGKNLDDFCWSVDEIPITYRNPELDRKVVDVLTTGLNSIKKDEDDSMFFTLGQAYTVLRQTLHKNPDLASEEVVNAIKKSLSLSLQDTENEDIPDYDFWEASYACLNKIAEDKPELASKVLETVEIVLNSDKNSAEYLGRAYSTLRSIVEKNPDLAPDALKAVKIGLNSDKNSNYSLIGAYSTLRSIAKANPKLAPDALEAVQKGLNSDKPDDHLATTVFCEILPDIVTNDDSAKAVFNILKENFEKNPVSSLRGLSTFIERAEDFAGETLEIVKDTLSRAQDAEKAGNKQNLDTSLGDWMGLLNQLSWAKPELADGVVDAVVTCLNLKSMKKTPDSLSRAYRILGKMVSDKPELAPKVFEVVKTGLDSDKNSEVSLKAAYMCLGKCAQQGDKELAQKVLGSVFKANPTQEAAKKAQEVLQAREAAKKAQEVLQAREAAKKAQEVLQANPTQEDVEKAQKVLQANPSQEDVEKAREVLQANPSQEDVEKAQEVLDKEQYKIYAYKGCMKKLKLEEIEGDIPNDLRIAYAGRNASDAGFEQALKLYSREFLASSCQQKKKKKNIFQRQWEVMGILKGTKDTEGMLTDKDIKSLEEKKLLIPAAFKLASLFKNKKELEDFLNMIKEQNAKSTNGTLSFEHLFSQLPKPMNKNASEDYDETLGAFLKEKLIYQKKAEGEDVHKHMYRSENELQIIGQNWRSVVDGIREEGRECSKLPYRDILTRSVLAQYNEFFDVRSVDFAMEAAKNGIQDNERYSKAEGIYLAGLRVPEPFDSEKIFKCDNNSDYTGRFLPRSDPRTIFFGKYTNCCQHYNGAGSSCAISTVMQPCSQLFVIEKNGEIIAGSWVWENAEGEMRDVCFDNIEALTNATSGESRNAIIGEIYGKVGEYLIGEGGCRKVTIGEDHSDFDFEGDSKKWEKDTNPIQLPKIYTEAPLGAYSDAAKQYVLAKAKDSEVKPIDRKQSYIRNACHLDDKQIEEKFGRKREIVLPEFPDYVVEDSQKGIVGYCFHAEGKYQIVMPEYKLAYREEDMELLKKLGLIEEGKESLQEIISQRPSTEKSPVDLSSGNESSQGKEPSLVEKLSRLKMKGPSQFQSVEKLPTEEVSPPQLQSVEKLPTEEVSPPQLQSVEKLPTEEVSPPQLQSVEKLPTEEVSPPQLQSVEKLPTEEVSPPQPQSVEKLPTEEVSPPQPQSVYEPAYREEDTELLKKLGLIEEGKESLQEIISQRPSTEKSLVDFSPENGSPQGKENPKRSSLVEKLQKLRTGEVRPPQLPSVAPSPKRKNPSIAPSLRKLGANKGK